MEKSFDVVVAGCGVAGLSAAVSAAEQGLTVAVLERASREERGGQSRFTEAYLRMKAIDEVADDFETHLAENVGPYVDPDMTAEMGQDSASWSHITRSLAIPDSELIGSFADHVPGTIQWLQGLGVKFDFLPTAFLTKTQPRLLPVGGGEALVEALAASAEALGVTFFYNTSARRLITDEVGTVQGIVAQTQGEGGIRFKGQVVLACGGFEGNPEMLAKYLGPRSVYIRPVCKGGYYNRGEGIEMALDAGAAACGEFGSYHAEPVDPRSGISEPAVFIFPYGILVNKSGKRFTDEGPGTVDAYYERVTRRIYEQEEGIAYVILDEKVKDVPNYRLAIRTDQPAIEGATLEALGEKLKLPAGALAETVRRYNECCPTDGKYDPLHIDGLATQGLTPPKSNWARPLEHGPFIAYPIISANVFTFGGLKINSAGQVLDTDGMPMANLYAAGETVGMYYTNYTGATSVLKGLVFGRLAAQHIADSPQ
ncbi:FAD-binding dehydrogenase [Pollutimonas nitritireducens]|uniref:FAD-binding dehydrogenase n=1 Tax=Pollutimonas nitritireducens TaxID=2045209 RepID=A0A2N4UEH4_9BURK|nr:FAD-dependent oxidoreductase [Pollutimonas nitritireducens]PLC53407.1 FAD-binding dehydrogenase [Pollutimonas nitritireducens]